MCIILSELVGMRAGAKQEDITKCLGGIVSGQATVPLHETVHLARTY